MRIDLTGKLLYHRYISFSKESGHPQLFEKNSENRSENLPSDAEKRVE